MAKDEIIKEIRKLLALNQTEQDVIKLLNDIGYEGEEAKRVIEESKKGYAIEQDLEKLRQMGGQQMEEAEEEKPLTEQEKRVRYLKEELGNLQNIIKTIRTDIKPEEKSEQDKKGRGKKK